MRRTTWPRIFGHEFHAAYDADPHNDLQLDDDTRADFLAACRDHLVSEAGRALAPYAGELTVWGELSLGTLADSLDPRGELSDLIGEIDYSAIIDQFIAAD